MCVCACAHVADLRISAVVVVPHADVEVAWHDVAAPPVSALLVGQHVHPGLLQHDGADAATALCRTA